MTTVKTLTIVAALLVSGTSLAMAQNGPATGGQPPVAGGAGGYPGYGYGNGYAAAPLYDSAPVADLAQPGYGYAAPGYGYAAPAQAGTTIIIVMAPAHRGRSVYAAPQVYTAPPVTTGYYGAPAVSQPRAIHPAIGTEAIGAATGMAGANSCSQEKSNDAEPS